MTRNTRREFYGDISKFFLDIAKLVLAGVILAGILKEDVSVLWLLGGGSLTMAVVFFEYYHFLCLVKSEKLWHYFISSSLFQ